MKGVFVENENRSVAYFSMEIALSSDIPTYSGGLGVLAGDTIRAAADLKVPMVAVSLLYRAGYFYQKIDPSGWQTEEKVEWTIQDLLQETDARTTVTLEGRTVHLRAWVYEVIGVRGFKIPVYFLDADLPENSDFDRTLTDHLYGGDKYYRLCQEVILGIGGVRILKQLGYESIAKFHLNEGHAALLTLELLETALSKKEENLSTHDCIDQVKRQCVFTTHTPVPAGHDQFSLDLMIKVLGEREAFSMKDVFCCEGKVNMTYLALNLSHYVNGVAKKHAEVSREMFPNYKIDSITNGVHAATWVTDPFCELFNRYIPSWKEDNADLRYALSIPKEEVWSAHQKNKQNLIHYIDREINKALDLNVLTLGFARRAATYKRADLLLQDIERLRSIIAKHGSIQIIYAGKAHPKDIEGKELIKKIHQIGNDFRNEIKVVYLDNYDMELGKMITSGVDVWLNTPMPPLEASGTSGMKAALNGVPSLSILDGWWIEGCIEGITGWAIDGNVRVNDQEDAHQLYVKLENSVVPMFYNDRDKFINIMKHTIALNGSFFNTQRMMQQYVTKAYFQ